MRSYESLHVGSVLVVGMPFTAQEHATGCAWDYTASLYLGPGESSAVSLVYRWRDDADVASYRLQAFGHRSSLSTH